MRKRWVGFLLGLFALLWAKLPGPPTRQETEPSHQFRCKRKDAATIEVSTQVREIPWLSERSTGIKMQKVERRPDGWYATEKGPLQSRMKVSKTSPGIAELRDLTPEMRERLLSSTGHHAIVIEVEEGQQEKMLIKGQERGIWRILRRE